MTAGGSHSGIRGWIALAVGIVAIAAVAGWWLATVTAPEYTDLAAEPSPSPSPVAPAVHVPAIESPPVPEPPLYLYTRTHRGADLELVEGEMHMAARAGIRHFIVSAALPWSDEEVDALVEQMTHLTTIEPEARLVVDLELDPPTRWLTEHPEEAVVVDGAALAYASPASIAWRAAVAERLAELARLASHEAIEGVVLAALEGGEWRLPTRRDTSTANREGFRRWLAARYDTDAALQEAWAMPNVTLADLTIPVDPPRDTPEAPEDSGESEAPVEDDAIAWPPAAERDYNRYLSDVRADAILGFAGAIKHIDPDFQVWVHYGYTLSASDASSGHFSLRRILKGLVDTIVYPMASIERGLGGVGGYAGPVHSVLAHGKRCVLVDETFTGLTKNAETGELERVRGMSYDTVSQIHYRNFISALVSGLGIAWADPEGEGRLHDVELWEQFGHMRTLYRTWYEVSERIDADASNGKYTPFPPGGTRVAIVVDEWSRSDDAQVIQADLIVSVVSAAYRCGVQVEVCLLDDVLDGVVDVPPFVLVPNAFAMDEEKRTNFHARLADRGAAVLWMYAPGAAGTDTDPAELVSAATGMRVRALEDPIPSGSVYALDSQWIRAGEAFAGEDAPAPRFFVDDENADVLATYADGGKASVAIVTAPEGWASIFVGEARLSPALLHELLQLLDIAPLSRSAESAGSNAYYLGPHLLGMHATEGGDTRIDFGLSYDVQDLFDPSQGWAARSTLSLLEAEYSTRLFMLTPPGQLPSLNLGVPPEDETSTQIAP